jgi:hypothetical protein
MTAPRLPPRPHRSSAHLHTQTLRLRNAADALLDAREEYRGRISPTDAHVPRLYVGHILAEDDLYGTACGLVVQGDQVSWRSLDALEVLARRGQLAHHRDDPHPPGVTPLTCPLCAAIFALDVHLVDGLAVHRAAGGNRGPESVFGPSGH